MDVERQAVLRAPFPDSSVGKLPRVTCPACRNSQSKVCEKHRKSKCAICDGYLTGAHIHLDYVGHADVTDRLLKADPEWSWEPVAFGPDGLPAFDTNRGLWIRLTVCGFTRLGYGHADQKTGPDATKETIGDALRNAAMRFGVGLDLWRKERSPDEEHPPGIHDSPVVSAPAAPTVVVTDDGRVEVFRQQILDATEEHPLRIIWGQIEGTALKEAVTTTSDGKGKTTLVRLITDKLKVIRESKVPVSGGG